MNNLDKIIDNDIIIITLDNAKDSVIKYINSKDKLYNIKVYSKSELLKNIYFSSVLQIVIRFTILLT